MTPEEIGDAVRSAPVPCVCGGVPEVQTYFGSRCDPYRVWCQKCTRCGHFAPSRGSALATWAECVAKWQEEER